LRRRLVRLCKDSQLDGLVLLVKPLPGNILAIACLRQQLVGAGEIEPVGLLCRRLPVEVGVVPLLRRHDSVPGLCKAAISDVAQFLSVYRVVQSVAEAPVSEGGVTRREFAVGTVETHIVPVVIDERPCLNTGCLTQAMELIRLDTDSHVNRAEFEVFHERIGVLVEGPHDLANRRLLTPIVGVPFETQVAAVLPLHNLEGTASHDRRLIGEPCRGLRGCQLLPDMLGQDGDVQPRQVGFGSRAGDPHRVSVNRLNIFHEGKTARRLIQSQVECECDVVSRHRLTIVPPRVVTQTVRPDLAVRRDAAVLLTGKLGGEPWHSFRFLPVPEQKVVSERPHVVAGVRIRGEPVQAVRLLERSDAEYDLAVGRGGRRA